MKSARKVALLLICLGIIFAVGACQTPAGRTAGEVVDDATITTKVKAKLFDESILRGFAISVDTFEGNVTLTGAVDNESQKKKAGEISASTYGVRKVNNLIMVKKPGS
jgi:hyperosmotically inducible protein